MSGSIPDAIKRALRPLRSHAARAEWIHEWRRRWAGEPALPPQPIERVLVLCHGNICRSPFAAAILARRIPRLAVDSGGLAAGDAAPADPTAVRVAARLGHDLSGHRSRPLGPQDLSEPDLVLVMEAIHARDFRARAPRLADRVYLLGDFLAAPPHAIPDPWGCPEAVFEDIFSRITQALERLVERLEARTP